MMIIPGPVIALCTFPGVIMHEIAHRFMCDILGVAVYDVRYFSMGFARSGYVLHHAINNMTHALLISLAPLLINSFFCILFTLPLSSSLVISGDFIGDPKSLMLWWVGFSMGANAFPSNQDVENILCLARENNNKSFCVWSICYFIKLLNFFSAIWLDFIYALGISFIVPYLIFG